MRHLSATLVLGLACLVACSTLTACDDLEAFRTGPDEVFYGDVIGSEPDVDTPSFIRRGFAPGTELEVTFDPSLAVTFTGLEGEGTSEPAGTLHSYRCPEEMPRCDEDDRTQGHFDHAELQPIPGLVHDALSQYDFPGGGRLKNFLFEARFVTDDADGSVQRHAMVFVSLMESGRMEVRVIAPPVVDDDGETERQPALFGVFRLRKRTL